MNDIDSTGIIRKIYLDEKNYFTSLVSIAYKKQLLNDDDITNFQVQFLDLLDKVVYKYTGLESSSIKKELLEDFSSSNMYTLGVYLKTFNNPDDAIFFLKKHGLVLAYEKGKKRINRLLDVTRVTFSMVKQNKLAINNDTYNDTLLGGIPGFLKIYDPDFKANDYKITADYPTFNSLIGKLEGVEFINEYLNFIYIENTFCNFFSTENIEYLLYGYSPNYKNLIINIFEIILFEVFACKFANKDIKGLVISEGDLNRIYLLLNSNDLNIIIETAYIELKKEPPFKSVNLQNYIEKNFTYMKALIKSSLSQKTLDKIFITQKFIYD